MVERAKPNQRREGGGLAIAKVPFLGGPAAFSRRAPRKKAGPRIQSGVTVEPSRTPLTLRPQPIAHAAHGMQQGHNTAIVLLATPADDIHVAPVGAGIQMIVTHPSPQECSRHHAGCITNTNTQTTTVRTRIEEIMAKNIA